MKQGDTETALAHAQLALSRDAQHPLAPVVMILAYREMGNEKAAQAVIDRVMAEDCMNNLVRWLGGVEEAHFFGFRPRPDRAGYGF